MTQPFAVSQEMIHTLASRYFEGRMPTDLESYLQVNYSDEASTAYSSENRNWLMKQMEAVCRSYIDGKLDPGLLEACDQMKMEIEFLRDQVDRVWRQDQKVEQEYNKTMAYIKDRHLRDAFDSFRRTRPDRHCDTDEDE